jgi:MATE family multidrug resistance protein
MVYFLWVITIPIALVWINGPRIIGAIVPEQATADLAGRYLQVLVLGTPGYAAFEAGKRFVQAQGKFSATLIVLLVCAPLNVFLHWLFVWVCIRIQCYCFITDDITEIPMGIHWSSYRRGDH